MATVSIGPGIRTNELDFSEYVQRLGDARFMVIGGASKGPLNTPQLFTNESALIAAYGKPLLNDYGLQAAVRFLRKGDQCIFMRVADSSVETADRAIPGLDGGVAAVAATGQLVFVASAQPVDGDKILIRDGEDAVAEFGTVVFDGGVQPADTDGVVIDDGTNPALTFEFESGGGITGDVAVTIGATVQDTLQNLIQAINGAALDVTATETTSGGDPAVLVTHDQPGDIAGVSLILNGGTNANLTANDFASGSDGTGVTFEFDDNAAVTGGNVGVLIGANANETMANLISAINASALAITAVNTTVTVPEATLTADNPGDKANQAMVLTVGTPGNYTATGMSSGADAVPGISATVMTLLAATPGTDGNGYKAVITTPSADFGAPAASFDLSVVAPVDLQGTEGTVERFTNLNLDPNSTRFVETVLASGLKGEFNPSGYFRADVLEDNGTPTSGTYQLGAGGGTVGVDGVASLASTDYIGTVNGQNATGLKRLRNKNSIEFNLIAIPGVTHKDVIAEFEDLVAFRGDCLGLLDPPFGLDEDEVTKWHNGESIIVPNAPTSPIDTSRMSLRSAWILEEDSYNKTDVWMPPSGHLAANFAESDKKSAPWFAMAGFNRGVLGGKDLEWSPDQDAINRMIGIPGQNRVNPIVRFAEGNVNFGNRTLYRKQSELSFENVRRMLLHAEKIIATQTKYLLFEPNDRVTWKKFERLANSVLGNIAANRGLEKFSVKMDESTNPPAQRQLRRMTGKLYLTPTPDAEDIVLDFAVFASGAEFDESTL